MISYKWEIGWYRYGNINMKFASQINLDGININEAIASLY